jgi:hypothetical protein
VVLVASTRVNTADEALRTALLAACRRHVSPDGQVVMHWLPPSWFDKVTSFTGRTWPVEISFEVESFDGTVMHCRATSRLDGATWEQRTSVRRLARAELHTALAGAGLRFDRHLRGGRQFFSAVPVFSAVPAGPVAAPVASAPCEGCERPHDGCGVGTPEERGIGGLDDVDRALGEVGAALSDPQPTWTRRRDRVYRELLAHLPATFQPLPAHAGLHRTSPSSARTPPDAHLADLARTHDVLASSLRRTHQ